MKYSRQDYLDKKCTHREYYAQFVTESVKDAVRRDCGKWLKSRSDKSSPHYSEDPHLNDLPLHRWDNMPMAMRSGMSLSDKVCILKEAARQIIEEESK